MGSSWVNMGGFWVHLSSLLSHKPTFRGATQSGAIFLVEQLLPDAQNTFLFHIKPQICPFLSEAFIKWKTFQNPFCLGCLEWNVHTKCTNQPCLWRNPLARLSSFLRRAHDKGFFCVPKNRQAGGLLMFWKGSKSNKNAALCGSPAPLCFSTRVAECVFIPIRKFATNAQILIYSYFLCFLKHEWRCLSPFHFPPPP